MLLGHYNTDSAENLILKICLTIDTAVGPGNEPIVQTAGSHGNQGPQTEFKRVPDVKQEGIM